MAVRHFALRRLSPFQGTLQVVEVPEGRAFSLDGIRWAVQLLSEQALRQPVWGNIGPASSERRYFGYGKWSKKAGLVRVPVNPSLGDPSRHPALGPLLNALEDMPRLPFPLADALELWLLDRADGHPIALVKSMTGASPPPSLGCPVWLAVSADERSFFSPALAKRTGQDAALSDRQDHAALLTDLVARGTGKPPRAQWFLRNAEGGGRGLNSSVADKILKGRRLDREDFPELLLREQWPTERDRALVRDYLDWQAPSLLTLPHLDRMTRLRLERAATRRPLLLYRYRKLIPEFADRGTVDPALVEAVLRQSA